jgi:hypothetical protein
VFQYAGDINKPVRSSSEEPSSVRSLKIGDSKSTKGNDMQQEGSDISSHDQLKVDKQKNSQKALGASSDTGTSKDVPMANSRLNSGACKQRENSSSNHRPNGNPFGQQRNFSVRNSVHAEKSSISV